MKRFAAALLATTCLTAPTLARAEPISLSIGLTAAIASTGVSAAAAATIGGAIVGVGIAAGVSVISSIISKTDAGEDQNKDPGGATLNVQYGAALARGAIMGPGAVGGHHVYTNVCDSGPGTGRNDILQCVFVIGDGQHGKLTRLRYNGKDCTLAPDVGTASYAIPEFVANGIPRVSIRYFRGRYDQAADAALVGASNPPGRWTANHRGAGVCYLSIDQAYYEELQLTGIPTVQIETEGLVLYDPRKDSTNGGSGAHRWGLTDTYEPSANPAVQEYNFRRGVMVNGQRLLGMAISPVNLILEMYFSAANINDEPVPLADGGTEARYRCSVTVSDDRANADVLDALRKSTAGFSMERGGQFGPIPGVAQIPVSSLAFNDDDLIVGEQKKFSKYRSRSELVTSIHGRFSDPAAFWATATYPAREDPADDAAIGEKIARDLDLTQVYSPSQAQRIAETERRRTLQQGSGTCVLPAKWLGVQPGDWLVYDSQRHGTMTVLVTAMSLDIARHAVTITYDRIANSVYSWTTAGELYPPDVGADAQPGTIVLIAAGMTAVGVNLPGDGGLVTPGIAFAWTPILDPGVDQIDFEIRKIGDTNILPFTAEFPSAGSAVCSGHGISAATQYEYRHKLYTTPYRDTPWSAWATVLSGTQHIVPNALTSIPGDVTLASFEAGLRDYVSKYLARTFAEVDRIEQLIASIAAEQEAANWLDLQRQKGADVTMRGQVSTLAGGGKTWRGDWDDALRYNPNDMVEHANDVYYTDVVSQGDEPPAAPWIKQYTAAVIAQNWITFAGPDGAAAQTSDSIEARFGTATTPISMAALISQWQAFAGPDYASAQTSDSIEARFGSATLTKSVATISTEWTTFAGPSSATAATHQQLIASIDGSSVTIAGNQTASAAINGRLVGTWQVTIDANGYVAGIKLYNTGTTSNFVVLADTFQVAKPGTTGPIPIFSVGTVNGVSNKMVFSGNFYADGTIYGNAIVAGSINAVKLAAGSIETQHLTADSAVYVRGWKGVNGSIHIPNAASGYMGPLNSQTFTIAKGNPCIIFASAAAQGLSVSWYNGDSWRIDLFLDGGYLKTICGVNKTDTGATPIAAASNTEMTVAIGLGIGTHTISLQLFIATVNAAGSPDRQLAYNTCDLSVQEPRNPQGT